MKERKESDPAAQRSSGRAESKTQNPKSKILKKLLDVVFIVVLGVVSVALLLAAQSYSAPAVARFRETRLKTNVLSAAGIPWTKDDFKQVFEERVKEQSGAGSTWFAADSLVIAEFKGRGLWGMIEGIVVLDSSLTRIVAVRVLAQEETPGLGDRIKEPSYLATYRGKTAEEPLELAMRHAATEPNEVDAITGATLSSQALVSVVTSSVSRLRTAAKGGAQ